MGGVLRRQSLGDQPQTTLSCDSSATVAVVTLRANAKEAGAHLKPWLGLCASNAGAVGSIPGQGTKILHAEQYSQENKFFKKLFFK